MGKWFRNVLLAVKTVGEGMYVTLWYFFQTYKRRAFTQQFEYPELPVPVKPRYRGFHRFDLTTCIGCDKCARACPVDCIYIEKIKNPVGKGFRVNGFKIDYTKCMFCALCVDRARSIASSWVRRTIRAALAGTAASSILPSCPWRLPGDRRRSTPWRLPLPNSRSSRSGRSRPIRPRLRKRRRQRKLELHRKISKQVQRSVESGKRP